MTAVGIVTGLLPCYEDPPAAALLAQVARHVDRLVLVGDGLDGPSAARLDALAGGAGVGAVALHLPRRSGKGHALAAGLAHVRATAPPDAAVVCLDADGQHPPEAIPSFLAAARDAELVVGNRFADARGMPLVRRVANTVTNVVVTAATGVAVPDSQCGMRLLRGRALFDVRLPGGWMESETLHLKACLGAGVPVAWVAIPVIYAGETSAFRMLRDSATVLAAAAARCGP
ncbi:MAG TPA: glycosyltransferase family 2 protein [Baekduia sp.]|nr:glycosyltransferase family 2 protein [Baekduia sp.]